MKSDYYTAIADGLIEGEDADAAYARMSKETQSVALASAKVTEAMVLSGLGMSAGATLLAQLEAALPAPAVRVLQSEGINVSDPEAKTQIGLMRGTIGDEAADWLLAQSQQTSLKWPGIKAGHVLTAIEMRSAGEI